MDVQIRKESSADTDGVYQVNRAAFGGESEAQLVDALRRNPDCFIPELSLIAVKDNQVLGYILLTKIAVIDRQENEFESLALAPVAVLPEYQKQGIGSRLIHAALRSAKELDYASVIVLGHAHYYPRFGFINAGQFGIKAPFDVPPDVFMAMELMPGGLKGISGTVRYPKEFDAAL